MDKKELPYLVPGAKTSLILGLSSILFSALGGVPGVALGIAALIFHQKARVLYWANPVVYSIKSLTILKIANVSGIFGVIVGLAACIFWLFIIMLVAEGESTSASPFTYDLF